MPSIQKTLRMYEFIKRYMASNSEAPLLSEIARYFNMRSSASVHAHLKKMEARGWIKRTRKMRGMQIVEQEQSKAA